MIKGKKVNVEWCEEPTRVKEGVKVFTQLGETFKIDIRLGNIEFS